MSLKNCRECGKMMQGTINRICQGCAQKREEEYAAVREYIKSNPKVAMAVVVEATGVDEKKVRDFLREGLIQAADFEGAPLDCRKCGKPIARGAYCAICQQDLTYDIKSGLSDRPKSSGDDKKPIPKVLGYKRFKG